MLTKSGAVTYCRVSTDEQVANFSLQTQDQETREYCKKNGFELVASFKDEGESAKTADRPGLIQMLEFCHKNRRRLDYLVIYAVDRLSRNNFDYAQIKKLLDQLGISIRAVTQDFDDTTEGKFHESLNVILAELDNNRRADRTKRGMEAAIKNKYWPFGTAIGYRKQYASSDARARIVHDPARAPFIKMIFELFDKDQHTKREILSIVSNLGLRTRKGRCLAPETLDQILRRPIYAGLLQVKSWDVCEPGDFEPIVDKDLFERVQIRLSGRSPHRVKHSRNNPAFPLTRFVRCSRCGKPLTASHSRNRVGNFYPYYGCVTKGCGIRIRAEKLEALFLSLLANVQPQTSYHELFRAVIIDVWDENRQDVLKKKKLTEERICFLKRREEILRERFIYEKAISSEDYEAEKQTLLREIALAEMEFHDQTIEVLDVSGVLEFTRILLQDTAKLWRQIDHEQKRKLQAVLFPDKITFDGQSFGTVTMSPIFEMLRFPKVEKKHLASPTGFEPVLPP